MIVNVSGKNYLSDVVIRNVEIYDDRSEEIYYSLPDYPIYINKTYLSLFPGFEFPGHWHEDIEITVILEGEMIYTVNGEKIHMKEGQGIFVNSRQLHSNYSVMRKECVYICMRLNPSLLCVSSSFEYEFVMPVIRCTNLPYIFFDSQVLWQNRVTELIKNIYELKNTKTLPLRTQTAFFEIWALLWENLAFKNNGSQKVSADLDITRNMVDFIQKNYAEKLSLADIAEAGAVGQSKCCKLFARYFGKSPVVYLNQYRINKSIELLKNTDLTITEISLTTGFSGASYYAETFKKYLGKTPSEYRHI
ncbi:MAG: AraC family transcriptional regulator [Clostridiales bacterium]|nr:AraC family transcriptional regulator [Clostridiales bacterium]